MTNKNLLELKLNTLIEEEQESRIFLISLIEKVRYLQGEIKEDKAYGDLLETDFLTSLTKAFFYLEETQREIMIRTLKSLESEQLFHLIVYHTSTAHQDTIKVLAFIETLMDAGSVK